MGLALRAVALAWLARTPLEGDALSYHETALLLARGTSYEPHWPPGLPAFLAAGYLVFGEHEFVARVLMIVVYLAFCAAVIALGRRLGGMRTANLALAVFAVTPVFIWSSVTPLTQLPTAALGLGAVYFADACLVGRDKEATSTRRMVRSALWLGACLTGLLLTRPSNVAIVGALPPYIWWRTRRWQTLVLPVVVVSLFVGMWTLKTRAMTGQFVFINTANSQNIFYGNNPWTPLYRTWWYGSHKEPGDMPPEFDALLHKINDDHKERERLFVKTAIDHIKDRPDLFAIRTGSRVRTFMAFDTFTSAQVAKHGKIAGALVLLLDASLYLLVACSALLLPGVMRAKEWGARLRARGARASDDASAVAAWADDRRDLVLFLLVIAFLYSLPYFFAFAHPTFHVPVTALVGLLGATTGAIVLETGVRPALVDLSRRGRFALASAFVVFFAIQIEWAAHLAERAPNTLGSGQSVATAPATPPP